MWDTYKNWTTFLLTNIVSSSMQYTYIMIMCMYIYVYKYIQMSYDKEAKFRKTCDWAIYVSVRDHNIQKYIYFL